LSEVFEFQTRLNASPEEVFAWHQRPGAFQALCPPWADVKVVEQIGGIFDGGKVSLELCLGPFEVLWNLEHRNFIEGKQFQDVQTSGPFGKWQHTHSFHKDEGGCILEDKVEFDLPCAPLPVMPASDYIKNELKRMFNYRRDILSKQLSLNGGSKELMKIAVSGSHGLIGSSLVPLLTTQGHEVRSLSRPGKPAKGDEIAWPANAASIGWEALEGTDAVVHLAGENIASRWTPERKKAIRESRINSTQALSEALAKLKNPPKVFICASAIGYYGDRGKELLDERSTSGAGFLGEVCREWEAATAAAKEAGIRVINARFGVVLSPKGGALAKMLPPFVMGAGGPVGNGEQYWSWIAIDDVAGAILHCINDANLNGPVNVVAPQAVTNNEFTHALGHVLHRPTFFPVPDFAARLAFGEMANELLLASTRVQPLKLQRSNYTFMYPDIEAALHHVLGK